MRIKVTAVALCGLLLVLGGGCSSSSPSGSDSTTAPISTDPGIVRSSTPAHRIVAHGGTEQIWMITDPKVPVALFDRNGRQILTPTLDSKHQNKLNKVRVTDEKGALVMRGVPPGPGYIVKRADVPNAPASAPVTVTSLTQNPPASFYSKQKLPTSYGYFTARDGVKIAINVKLPGPAEKGPYPTVIEYSGYDPASPDPSSVTAGERIAGLLGFATVGVNIRGSGCSGGSFQLWEHAQSTDGYDAVEAVAAQPWVLGHRVGMVGISYPATSMLYVAATQPPHLAAIASLASYDDGFRALLWPGGIQNSGFAREWINERYAEAKPAADDWVKKRIAAGDKTCAHNMDLRGQNFDLSAAIDARPFFPTDFALGDSFAPVTFAHKITVPTFLEGAWQDEQVGGHYASIVPALKTKHRYLTFVNGNHTEGLAIPSVLQQWDEFLQLYVARRVPDTNMLRTIDPTIVSLIFGGGGASGGPITEKDVPFPPEHFSPDMTFDEALAKFEAQKPVRILLDNGAAPGLPPGMPVEAFEADFDTYPIPSAVPTTLYLGSGGALSVYPPTAEAGGPGTTDTYVADPAARPRVDLVPGSDVWSQLPKYDWTPVVAGKSLSYLSTPMAKDVVAIGSASVNLWLKSSAADTDLQVTLSEVRPDGNETYVQTGWLRASKRKLDDKRSTTLQPLQTMLQADSAPLPGGKFTPVRLEIYPFGHAFRTGSRVRITITAPNGDKPVWAFVTLPGTQTNTIAHDTKMPSAIVLPVVPGIEVPTPLPPCPALRGQPCRTYVTPGPQG